MKIKQSFREKLETFVRIGRTHSFSGAECPFDKDGKNAIEAFLIFESTGKLCPCSEPEIFAQAISGKKVHAITVEQKAAAWLEGTYTKHDLEAETEFTRNDVAGAIRKKGGRV